MTVGISTRSLTGAREHSTPLHQVTSRPDFRYCVAPRRGLDIPFIEHRATGDEWRELLWTSGTGVVDPAYFDGSGKGALRSFHGGFFTCGPENAGPPAEGFPTHGSLSYTPADAVRTFRQGDDLTVAGTLRVLYPLGGPQFQVQRRVVGRRGRATITICDAVTNVGRTTAELMWKYHPCFAVVGGSQVVGTIRRVVARDAAANHEIADWGHLCNIYDLGSERVYTLDVATGKDDKVRVGLAQGDGSWGMVLTYDPTALPCLNLWKHTAEGVVGLEPGNCNVMGLTWEREQGTLARLEAGVTRSFTLEMEFVFGRAEVTAMARRLSALDDGTGVEIVPWVERTCE